MRKARRFLIDQIWHEAILLDESKKERMQECRRFKMRADRSRPSRYNINNVEVMKWDGLLI